MLKILIPIKRVPDPASKLRLHPQHHEIDLNNVRMVLNPYDEVALEEAVRWKETGQAREVITLTVGSNACDETLRSCLALGADQACRIEGHADETALDIAHAIADFATTNEIDLILCGLQSSDEENGQIGPMLAALLDWPLASAASSLTLQDAGQVHALCETEQGTETWALSLPAVITADLQLNTPRFARLPAIIAAKRKAITVTPRQIQKNERIHTEKQAAPNTRSAVQMLRNVDELTQILLQELRG